MKKPAAPTKKAGVDKKKGLRTIAPRKSNLVQNNKMIKVCLQEIIPGLGDPALLTLWIEIFLGIDGHDGKNTWCESWTFGIAKGWKEE